MLAWRVANSAANSEKRAGVGLARAAAEIRAGRPVIFSTNCTTSGSLSEGKRCCSLKRRAVSSWEGFLDLMGGEGVAGGATGTGEVAREPTLEVMGVLN